MFVEPMSDTTPAAAAAQAAVFRAMTPERRIALCVAWTRILVTSSRAALAKARPELSRAEVLREWVRLQYGVTLPEAAPPTPETLETAPTSRAASVQTAPDESGTPN